MNPTNHKSGLLCSVSTVLAGLLLALLLAQLSACTPNKTIVSAAADGVVWELDEENKAGERQWKRCSREVEGSRCRAFMITGEIAVSPTVAVQVLRDKMENSTDYLTEKEGYITILRNTSTELVAYSVYRLPMFFKDRAMCERFTFSEDAETGVLQISWDQDWSLAPPLEKGVIAMPVAKGSWTFYPLGSGRSQAIYEVHAEPGGNIPPWMANSTVGKGLYNELVSIEETAQKLGLSARL